MIGKANNIAIIPKLNWFFMFCSLYFIADITITTGTDNLKYTATIDTGKIFIEE